MARLKEQPTEWFQFYPALWRQSRKVRLMTRAQRDMYLDLLIECWYEGFIPEDPELVARLLGEPAEQFLAKDWPVLSTCFKRARRGSRFVLHSPRMSDIKAKSLRYFEQKRNAGKNGRNKQLVGTPRAHHRGSPGHTTGVRPGQDRTGHNSTEYPEAPPDPSPQTPTDPTEPPADRPPGPSPHERIPDLTPTLRSMDAPTETTREDARIQATLVKLGEVIHAQEKASNGGGFNPFEWISHSRKLKRAPPSILATLGQYARRLEVGHRPEEPWAYCETTYREKEANYHGDRAEAASAARLKAAGRDTG